MSEIRLAGENSIIIYFDEHIRPELIDEIHFYQSHIKQALSWCLIEVVPAYTTLMLTYDLNRMTHADFCHEVESILSIPFVETKMTRTDISEIPVYYGSEVGLDLALVLKRSGLSLAELIELHSGRHYLTYAIGFSPVFAFLGSLDQQIHFPRLATPRISIPAGSVGIAGEQTAVYPIQSSGGWNIIGRTPLDLSLTNPFNIERFEVGTYVKFVPISREQYLMQGGSL